MSTPSTGAGPTSATPAAPAGASARTAALQRVLAAQHAAVYAYSIIGVHLDDPAQVTQARELQAQHRLTRDAVMSGLVSGGVVPQPAAAQYTPEQKVIDAKTARGWALSVEEDCALAYRMVLAAAGTSAQRRSALSELTSSAVDAMYWRSLITPTAPTVAFPGIKS